MNQRDLLTAEQLASKPGRPGVIPVSKATIYRLLKQGAFPTPIRLSQRKTLWRRSDIDAWLDSRRGSPA